MNPAPAPTSKEARARLGYRAARAVAAAAAVFSLTVLCLMLFNHVQLHATDPINSEALQTLIEQHNRNPGDAELQAQIRDLDLLARRAFFSSLAFSRRGAYLLVLGLGIWVVALKTLAALRPAIPDPRRYGDMEEALGHAALVRWTVSLTGVLVVAAACALVLTFRSAVPPAGEEAAEPAPPPAGTAFPPREEFARNWPAFRGPGGTGHTGHGAGVPTEWDMETGRNVRWKAEVPRPGFSSPVVWGNRLFVTGADREAREVFCYDTESGELRWRRTVPDLPGGPVEVPELDEETGLAPLTPATDGRHLAAMFVTGELVCFDVDGNLAWGKNLGLPRNAFGHAASLMVFEDLLLVQLDQDEGGGRLTAYRMATGDVAWERMREVRVSWSTPLVADTGDGVQVIVSGNPLVSSFALRSGKELWSVSCMEGEVAPSPAFAGGLAFFAIEYGRLTAVDVRTGEVRWSVEGELPDVASPVAAGGCIFTLTNGGSIACFAAENGEVLWTHENEEGFYASPIVAGDRLYLVDVKGGVDILEAGPTYRRVSRQSLGEAAVATPAVQGGRIYFRGHKNLYCVGAEGA